MIESLILWFMGKGLSEKASRAVLLVIGVVVILLISATMKSCYDNRVIDRHEDKITIEQLENEREADDDASDQRAKDTIANEKKSEKRSEAISKETDQPPSDASRALGCQRLREAGYDTTKFPACRGR